MDIRAEFNRINSNSSLRTVVLNNEEFLDQMTDSGGKLTGYFENNELVKITVWVGLSYGSNETDYYFKDDELFFAYQRENKFVDELDEEGERIFSREFEQERFLNYSNELAKQLREKKKTNIVYSECPYYPIEVLQGI